MPVTHSQQESASPLLAALVDREGRYSGSGVNHERKPFDADLRLRSRAGGHAVEITYRAVGLEGAPMHEELSVISSFSEGGLCLWTVSTGRPYVLDLPLRSDQITSRGDRELIFGAGDPRDLESFRMEIVLMLGADGGLDYAHRWGLPGEELVPRSSVSLARVITPRVGEI